MVISSTAPPIIRDAVAISIVSDREGAKKAWTGRRRSGILGQRFEGESSVDRAALVVRSGLPRLLWSRYRSCVARWTNEAAHDVQMRTLAMHIPSPLNMAQATPLSLQADSFYFGWTKKSRAVSQPSAPSTECSGSKTAHASRPPNAPRGQWGYEPFAWWSGVNGPSRRRPCVMALSLRPAAS
jgi:hypothetical protein